MSLTNPIFSPILSQFRQELEPKVTTYVGTLALAASLIAAGLIAEGFALGTLWSTMALALIAAIAERGRVHLTDTTEESISLLPMLFAAVLFGPLAGMFVGAASLVGEFGQPPYLKWITYTSTRAICGAATGLSAMYVIHLPHNRVAGIALATAVGAVVAEALDVGFAALTHRLRKNGTMRNLVRTLAPLVLASVSLFVPVVTLLAVAYEELSPLTLPLFFVPALAAQRLFALYQEQRTLADELLIANARLERANLSFATALVATLDARDQYTAGHSAAVAIYARDIARRMDLSERDQAVAHLCGLVHDIGKIGLPAGLLEKPGALTLEERRLMERHSEIGERILTNVDDYAEIASIVRHHHERVDGNGYPDGLSADAIPLISRIVAVADAYNAMTSDRPYREAMPSRVARIRLAQAVESQFDTSVVAAFEALLAGATETYRLGVSADFAIEASSHDSLNRKPAAPAVALAQ
jgi:putative nucleotidyltransferase with HDIG domain